MPVPQEGAVNASESLGLGGHRPYGDAAAVFLLSGHGVPITLLLNNNVYVQRSARLSAPEKFLPLC